MGGVCENHTHVKPMTSKGAIGFWGPVANIFATVVAVCRGHGAMSPNLPDKMLFRGIPPRCCCSGHFMAGGVYAPDALAKVRRHMASICDKSCDLVSIMGKSFSDRILTLV